MSRRFGIYSDALHFNYDDDNDNAPVSGVYASSAEPMRKPDHKLKPHPRPERVRIERPTVDKWQAVM